VGAAAQLLTLGVSVASDQNVNQFGGCCFYMGRQVQFHALREDCQELLSFVNDSDVVTIVVQDHTEPELAVASSPLGTELRRTLVPQPARPYFRVRTGVGLEFSHSALTEWNGHPGLTQGRVYINTDQPNELLVRWYERVARWIRTHWTRCPEALAGYVGPNAIRWHSDGGLLLPTFLPPVTPEWTTFFSAQLGGGRQDA
jgi:hypothetical protein